MDLFNTGAKQRNSAFIVGAPKLPAAVNGFGTLPERMSTFRGGRLESRFQTIPSKGRTFGDFGYPELNPAGIGYSSTMFAGKVYLSFRPTLLRQLLTR